MKTCWENGSYIDVSTTHTKKNDSNKQARRKLVGDGYVYGLDSGDGFTGIYLFLNSLSSIH